MVEVRGKKTQAPEQHVSQSEIMIVQGLFLPQMDPDALEQLNALLDSEVALREVEDVFYGPSAIEH